MKQLLLFPALTAILITSLNVELKLTAERNQMLKENKLKPFTMQTENYTSTILVPQDPKAAFHAVKNFRAWWSEDIDGETDKLNKEFLYHYKDVHICKIKLIESIPDKKLVYKVLDNQFSFTKDKTEWVGTKLIFDISKEGKQTKVQFTHEGLVPAYECYKVCYDAWGNYIQKSLYSLITTGKGEPNPKNKDGFNAELADKWKIKH